MKTKNTFILSTLLCLNSFGQTNPIDIVENTLKIGGLAEEVYFCGLAEGDQLIFNFNEVNGKELKEIEIIEMPGSSKFMDYKSKKIENKTLSITKTGIYKFRFLNGALLGRICKFKIQRIPATEQTKNFNTSVYWKTVNDTTFSTVNEKYLVKSDTTITNITNQTVKVHSSGNLNGNTTEINFALPANTVAWSYYIGVDQAGQQVYEKATKELAANAAPIIAKIPGYGPMAALALGGVSYLSQLQAGEDIDFYIVDGNNINLFKSGQPFNYLKKGKIINDFSKMTTNYKGQHIIYFSNDNAVTGVTVAVKVTAIEVSQQWGTRPVKKINVSSREEAYLKN